MNWEEDEDFKEFVRHTREHTVKGMAESAFVMSLVPRGEPDIKFAVELGLSILMGKPIIALRLPGVEMPGNLAKVADHVIDLDDDLDTEAGQEELRRKLEPIMEALR